MSSNLDFQQILQDVHDPAESRLKVDTGAVINFSGQMEVAIDATDDNIAIKNSTSGHELVINADGSINVTSSGGSSNVVVTNGSGASAVNIQDGGNSITVDATSLPLPTGAATSANQTTANTSLSSIDTKLSSQATAANQTTGNTSLSSIDTKLSSQATAANQTTANSSLSSIDGKIPSSLTVTSTRLLVDPSGVTQPVNVVNATTPSQSTVASSASNVTLLSSNSSRKGATIFNDSTQILYLKLGTTASTSSYTLQIAALGYYEVPFKYSGQIDGIWASANGNARITELT